MILSNYVDYDTAHLIQKTPYNLTIPANVFNKNIITSFVLSNMTSIRHIDIGNNSLTKVRLFELNGLSELESVVIGGSSVRIGNNERNDGLCRIVNCPKLKSIQIGNESFEDYHSFEISNLPSLQSIEIGSSCFQYVPSFSLIGLID